MRILFIGDIIGQPGRNYLLKYLRQIKNKYTVDLCIGNGENSAHGNGATMSSIGELYEAGIDVVTMGNHTFKRDMTDIFDSYPFVIRPGNYPSSLPGCGSYIFDNLKTRVLVLNAVGRIYMEPSDSPFAFVERELSLKKGEFDIAFLDFHCEATSEKAAMAHFLDGKVCCVAGTHTHVQTADEKILSKGTAFITDVGMTGPFDSVLGVSKEVIVSRFVNFQNKKFEIPNGKIQFNGIIVDADEKTGLATSIERIVINE